MPITAEYDRDADALYVRIAEGERARAIEVNDVTYVDVDAENRPLGIELLYPSMGLDVLGLATTLSLEARLGEIIAAITSSDAPVQPLTMTGGQYLGSTSMQHGAVQGTIAATVMCDTNVTFSSQSARPLIASPC